MTANEIISLAWQDNLPDGLTTADRLLWFQARVMRLDYNAGRLPADVGKELKLQYIAEHNQNVTKEALTSRMLTENALRYAQMEPLIDSFRTQPTIEKANAVIDLFYGFIPKGVTPNE